MDNSKIDNNIQHIVHPQEALLADEIDLLDLLRILMRHKQLIVGITAFCTILATGVAFLLPREYKAELTIMPPSSVSVEVFNIPSIIPSIIPSKKKSPDSSEFEERSGLFYEVKPQDLYEELVNTLMSRSLRFRFFKENDLFQLLSIKNANLSESVLFEQKFSKKLNLTGITKDIGQRDYVTITLVGENPKQIKIWLSDFVELADKTTITNQNKYFAAKVKMVKENISKRIESLRTIGKAHRLDRIASLEEAVAVAEKLGLSDGADERPIVYKHSNRNGRKMSFTLQEKPLFFRGTKTLKAEIDILKQRKNDDAFIPELRILQEQFNLLSFLKHGVDKMHSMTVDGPVIVDDRPIKPKRKLIVVLGFVLGVLLSIVVTFIWNMVAKTS
jgi:chain length determinant protein (polysaccharide antigen chain regulator)